MTDLVVVEEFSILAQQPDDSVLVEQVERVEIVAVAEQGPPGPPGPGGLPGGTAQIAVAGEALGGHRAVVLDASGSAFYADCGLPTHFGRVAGITDGAVAAGAIATLVSSGVMVEPSWSWTPNTPVFLSHTGLLTQSAPSGAFQQVVGVALSATSLFINPREPVITA